MKTLFKTQEKIKKSISLRSTALLLLVCIIFSANAIAQKITPGPILNSNPANNHLQDVTIYEHDNFNENFNGRKMVIKQNTPNLAAMNDRTTAIVVPLGKKVTLYAVQGYQGKKITLYPGNYSHIYAWNDRASSIKIESIPLDEPVAYFFRDTDNIYTNQVFQGSGPGKIDLDNMVCYDCFSHLLVVGQISVVGYDYANWKQRNNEENPFKEGKYNLADWGLNNAIASYEIVSHQYALSRTVLKKSRLLSQDTEKTIAVAATGTNTNVVGSPEMEGTVSGCFEASATQSFDAATTVGISTAVRTSVEVGVEGVAKATIEYELAAKLETTLTTGNATTVTESQCWEVKRTIPVPQGCEGKITLIATPEVREWTIEKHYVPVDSKGEPIPGGKPKIVTGKMKVTKGIGSTTNISLNEGCNQGNTTTNTTNSNTTTATTTNTNNTTNTDTSTTTTGNQTTSTTTNRLDNVTEVEFCDGDGNVVGFYIKEGSNWTETDANGNSRFNYSESGRDENSIYLADLQRQGVKIMLNFHKKEILYSDNNNTSPYKLYAITDFY